MVGFDSWYASFDALVTMQVLPTPEQPINITLNSGDFRWPPFIARVVWEGYGLWKAWLLEVSIIKLLLILIYLSNMDSKRKLVFALGAAAGSFIIGFTLYKLFSRG